MKFAERWFVRVWVSRAETKLNKNDLYHLSILTQVPKSSSAALFETSNSSGSNKKPISRPGSSSIPKALNTLVSEDSEEDIESTPVERKGQLITELEFVRETFMCVNRVTLMIYPDGPLNPGGSHITTSLSCTVILLFIALV